jgi:2-polyprenyl-3-methyl-5-hydroxy-6-metoxy-1,4-benzoquinol methylase
MTRSLNLSHEQTMLDHIALDSRYASGMNSIMIEYTHRIFSRYTTQGTMLELGPAEGIMTSLMAQRADSLTVVEGAAHFCEDLRHRFPGVNVIHSLFESYNPQVRFDSIILSHVLEHVLDPVAVLTKARSWLADSGQILAAVPNARSLHRQAAVLMGLLQSEDELNDADRHHGHRRVFNPETFRHVFLAAGFRIQVFGGYWIKPLSNRQLEETWSPEMVEAFMQLGERYPDIAAENYIIASL